MEQKDGKKRKKEDVRKNACKQEASRQASKAENGGEAKEKRDGKGSKQAKKQGGASVGVVRAGLGAGRCAGSVVWSAALRGCCPLVSAAVSARAGLGVGGVAAVCPASAGGVPRGGGGVAAVLAAAGASEAAEHTVRWRVRSLEE